jgi:hypothetical protein
MQVLPEAAFFPDIMIAFTKEGQQEMVTARGY